MDWFVVSYDRIHVVTRGPTKVKEGVVVVINEQENGKRNNIDFFHILHNHLINIIYSNSNHFINV